jgi:hypothetical protein
MVKDGLVGDRSGDRKFVTLRKNEYDTTAQNQIEMPDQKNIALKNPYTRNRLAPYAQQVSCSTNCPKLLQSAYSDHR